jgi:hypothetical protein
MGPERRRTAWDVILDDQGPLYGMPEWVKVGQEVEAINGELQGTITAIKPHVRSKIVNDVDDEWMVTVTWSSGKSKSTPSYPLSVFFEVWRPLHWAV